MTQETKDYLVTQLKNCHAFWLRQYHRIGYRLALPLDEHQALTMTIGDCFYAYIDKTVRGELLSFDDVNIAFYEAFGKILIPDLYKNLHSLSLSIVPNGEIYCTKCKINDMYYMFPEGDEIDILDRYEKKNLTPPSYFIPENIPPVKYMTNLLKGRRYRYCSLDGSEWSYRKIKRVKKHKIKGFYTFVTDIKDCFLHYTMLLNVLNNPVINNIVSSYPFHYVGYPPVLSFENQILY